MIQENKIITLENKDKYLTITKVLIDNKEFVIGIKLVDEKYINEFKFFAEIKKNDEIFLEEITDEALIKIIANSYILSNI